MKTLAEILAENKINTKILDESKKDNTNYWCNQVNNKVFSDDACLIPTCILFHKNKTEGKCQCGYFEIKEQEFKPSYFPLSIGEKVYILGGPNEQFEVEELYANRVVLKTLVVCQEKA
jgi:hypothetical protein